MPQMSPISWTFIFVMSMLLLIMVMTSMKLNSFPSSSPYPLKIKENKMKW